MNGIMLSGPAGSTLAIGPTTLDAPAWVQAIGSVVALVLAIWVTREQRRQHLNDAIVQDAAFADYIERFLGDLENTFKSLDYSIDEVGTKEGIASAAESALSIYKRHVIDRLEKLSEMDLTSWPDIEFAHTFNEAYLDMNGQFVKLEQTATELAEADVIAHQEKQHQVEVARRRAAEEEALEDEMMEQFLGDEDNDVVISRQGSERWADVARRGSSMSDEEYDARLKDMEHERDLQRYLAEEDERYARLEWEEEKEILRERLIQPLYDITRKWKEHNAPLCQLIEAYKAGVPDRKMNFRTRASQRRYRSAWDIF